MDPLQDKIRKVQLLRVCRSCRSHLGDVISKEKPGDQAKMSGFFGRMKGGRVKKRDEKWLMSLNHMKSRLIEFFELFV